MFDDFKNLLESGIHSDIILVVKGKEFPVHKAILSARSPVFAAMFEHEDTKEANEGKVEITDILDDVFQELLNYTYTSRIPIKEQLTPELLSAADKVCQLKYRYVSYYCTISQIMQRCFAESTVRG